MMMTDEEVEMRCLVSYADSSNENEKKMFDEEEEHEDEEEGRKKKMMMMMQSSIRDAKNSGDSFQST